MSVVDDYLVLEDGREVRIPGISGFRRFGQLMEWTMPFDSTRETFVRRSVSLDRQFWQIYRQKGARCVLDESQLELTLPAGIYQSALPITVVAQIGRRFILFYRDGVDSAPVDCVADDGTYLWRVPKTYLSMAPVMNTEDFLVDDGSRTSVYSAVTGQLLSEQRSH